MKHSGAPPGDPLPAHPGGAADPAFDIRRQIGEYRTLLLIVGAVLCALVLEYQNFLQYGFTYSSAGIPAVTSALRNSFLGLLTSVILAAAAGMLFFKNRNIRRENDLLLMKEEMEQQKYKELSAAVEKNRELVHDAKNHYLVIREYIRKGDYESLDGYVDGLQQDFARTDAWVYTGNPVLDLILGQKRMTAQSQGFSFKLQAPPLSGLPFSDREICSLFGNLLTMPSKPASVYERGMRNPGEDRTTEPDALY